MNHRVSLPRQRLLTSALLLALASPALAQQATDTAAPAASGQAATDAGQDTKDLDTVQVVGIRASLTSSMNLKRDSQGIVDGIVAEDIGKFPDTNLAESMQRISGVSIDRVNGEGSKVTVRGIGPDYNLVLLNGRQMPASSLLDTGASASRSFDFANLASEAISELQVYKTGRVDKPTGGLGATINIVTTRPLDNPGTHGSFGLKGVWDTTNGNLPDSMQGDDLTPEASGIFSTTTADGRFGIAVTGSYQKRDFGYSQVGVTSGWHNFTGDEVNWGTIPLAGAAGSENIVNRPGAGDVYSVPQNINYSVNGVQRERTNGQLTLQWRPIDNLTATLDYTYAQNRIEQKRNELSAWFNYGPSFSGWTDGPVAGPDYYGETIGFTQGEDGKYYASDLAMGGALNKTKSTLKSLGFNVKWDVTDNFHLGLDYHDSSSESGADSPIGSNVSLGTAAFVRGTTVVDFSKAFPVMSVQLPPGMDEIDPADMLVTGSSFRNSYMKSTVKQFQLDGDFEFEDYSRLDFGVASTEVQNRSAYGYVQADTWGGIGSPADFDDSLFKLDHLGSYFGNFVGHNSSSFSDSFFVWDFDKVRQAAIDYCTQSGTCNPDVYTAPTEFSVDRRTTEKTRSAFLQWSKTFDWAIPVSVAGGVRYEKTTVDSKALVPNATAISWGSANELSLVTSGSGFTHLTGEYKYWLPALDISADLTDKIKLRGSYSETLGRPTWDAIQGGQTLDALVRVDGGTGSQGNPNLKPLLSHNFDVSFEWYFKEGSYFSVGYFRKNIDNYIGTTQVVETPFNLHTPVGGAYWNEALSGGCASSDVVCIRDYIFANHNGDPGVTQTGTDSTGHATGTIVGQEGDPVANFRITQPANQRSASLDGWEFNLQTLFGDTGFGVAANYTIVSSGLTYKNAVLGEQFALVGLSNTANLVGFYDKDGWTVRVAYNWRDKFLSGLYDGTGANPNYTEPYGQLDVSIGYQMDDHWSFSLEGINVTDETLRIHGRNYNDLLYLTQNGPRYMLGVRYKF